MKRCLVARLDELQEGGLRRADADGVPICLARTEDGAVYAISDICSHEEQSLSEGDLFGYEVECPLHNSSFDVRNGKQSGPPAFAPVAAYPVTVEDGDVYVDVDAGT
jgi:3-phenylpropionate/trans-cinnamate dioxygenase ferredoxin subunit